MGPKASRTLALASLLAACAGAPAHITLNRDGGGEGKGEGVLAYDYHDARLRRDTEGRWSVTLLRRDRSGGPSIQTYPDTIVESILIPLPDTLAKDARLALRRGRPLEFRYSPMEPGTAVHFRKGEVVIEAWDPQRRRVRGRFSATARRETGKPWSIQGAFDAHFAGE